MSDETKTEAEGGEEAPKKKGGIMMPLIFGLVGALLMGGGAAFTVSSGMVDVPGLTDSAEKMGKDGKPIKKKKKKEEKPKAKPAFVELAPLAIPVMMADGPRQLRMLLMVETEEGKEEKIEKLTPRIQDALNTLLRAIDPRDLGSSDALDRLRAQMLRRVKLATDDAPVTDLLIVEYIVV